MKYTKTIRPAKGFGPFNPHKNLESLHAALLERHKDSVAAVAQLTELMEGLGAELVDTGAYYDSEGNQESGRDACFDLHDDTELVCRVYHDPRKVEIEYNYDRPLPPDIAEAIKQWEAAA